MEINKKKSEVKNTLHGIPQGYVLDPLPFLIYFNDWLEHGPFINDISDYFYIK